MNQDLTTGKADRVLWKFCLPLFGSILFQQLYNIADSFVAGKFINNNALAAVGNSYEITLIFLAFAFGCNIGCSVLVAQLFGAKRYNDVRTVIYTTLIASGALCILLMVLGTCFCDQLLELIHTPKELFNASKKYLDIYIYSLPFVFYYNVATGIFSALGDSKTPFDFLACSSLANIGMDILFVAKFHMHVEGVAWATFICQGISCLLALLFVVRRIESIPSEGHRQVFSWRWLRDIAIIAVPSILQQSFISVGNVIIQSLINNFGPDAIAGYSAAIKLNNMVITAFSTLSNGISSFAAQNLGAKKPGRVREGFRAGLKMIYMLAVPIVALYLIAGRPLIYIFLDSPTGDAMDTGLMFLRIVAPFYLSISTKLVADGILRGAGKMRLFLISTFTDLGLRVLLACLLSNTHLQTTGIWLSWPVGWFTTTVMSLLFYRHFIRKNCVSAEPQA